VNPPLLLLAISLGGTLGVTVFVLRPLVGLLSVRGKLPSILTSPVMSSKPGEALVGSEITRDHQRKMGEAGSSTGPVVQLCGSPRDLKPRFRELGDSEYSESENRESENRELENSERCRNTRQRTGAKGLESGMVQVPLEVL